MASNTVRNRETHELAELRKQAGLWLRQKRDSAGLSQRELAGAVGFEYYTFISQIEAGRGKVPAERFEAYAKAVKVDAREFAMTMLRHNDPHTYSLIFGTEQPAAHTGVVDLEARLRRLEARLPE
ncbi:MAG: helix-turn-helix transcriptional regulator [Devosia sp.]|uniref:helix-turn-helix domain-containing protein n=1 Tax=Devosia sp. TaxID=1871048 RepID=UPI0019F4B90C|nr:helix-turn-helix transcriptional regulator [Devosia sp.]MBF0680374.1 helix-turn-helix transcriptional regulator [Devosia sp.]